MSDTLWKSTTTAVPVSQPKAATDKKTEEDDDWDTDPDFVNNVSEKDQRWGIHKQNPGQRPQTDVDLHQLRQNVVEANSSLSKQNWEALKGKDEKASYGLKK